jgi:hypothetical protein
LHFERGQLTATVEISDFDDVQIDLMNSKLLDLGGDSIRIEFYFDQSGESQVYANIGNQFSCFYSEKEIKQATKEFENTIDLAEFNFGKNSLEYTGVLRLHILSKSKRIKISDAFNITCHNDKVNTVEQFSYDIVKLIKPEHSSLIRLCKANFEGTKPWQPPFRQLIRNIKFSLIQGDYIYIGFDMNDIDYGDYSLCELIEILPLVLERIDGVKRVWLKFKQGKKGKSTQDLYVRWPGNHEGGPVSEDQIGKVSTGYDQWEGSYS